MGSEQAKFLLSYLNDKDKHAIFIDEQVGLQLKTKQLISAFNKSIEQDIKEGIQLSTIEVNGRQEHARLLEFIDELEKEIEEIISVICKKHNLVLHSKLTLGELQAKFPESAIEDNPPLFGLIAEYFGTIGELMQMQELLNRLEVFEVNFCDDIGSIDNEQSIFIDDFDFSSNSYDPLSQDSEHLLDMEYTDNEEIDASIIDLVHEVVKEVETTNQGQDELQLVMLLRRLQPEQRMSFMQSLMKIKKEKGAARKGVAG